MRAIVEKTEENMSLNKTKEDVENEITQIDQAGEKSRRSCHCVSL